MSENTSMKKDYNTSTHRKVGAIGWGGVAMIMRGPDCIARKHYRISMSHGAEI
jgi:hypothetical protein